MSRNTSIIDSKDLPKAVSKELERFGFPDLDIKLDIDIAHATRESGQITNTKLNVLAPPDGTPPVPSNQCRPSTALDVFGSGRTGADGKAELRLTHFLCRDGSRALFDPAFVVATARPGAPVVMTANAVGAANDRDVIMQFESWATDGSPAASVAFNWSCRATTSVIVD